MQALMKAAWRIWPQENSVFHVKEDGARLGQPGKEFTICKITLGSTQQAIFGVPTELGAQNSTFHL